MSKKEIFVAIIIALFCAVILSPFASETPDGLEKVAEEKSFIEQGEREPIIYAPVPDYVFPWIKSEGMATATAGAFGTLIMFFLVYGIARMLKRPNAKKG